jgi:hypothetical protein
MLREHALAKREGKQRCGQTLYRWVKHWDVKIPQLRMQPLGPGLKGLQAVTPQLEVGWHMFENLQM